VDQNHGKEVEDMTRQTADSDDAVIRHKRTSEPDMTWAQQGWEVYDRSGLRVGRITQRDDDSILVSLDADAGSTTRIPTKVVAVGSPEDERVTLAIDRDELDQITQLDMSDVVDD
jgi:hypothetical protein